MEKKIKKFGVYYSAKKDQIITIEPNYIFPWIPGLKYSTMCSLFEGAVTNYIDDDYEYIGEL